MINQAVPRRIVLALAGLAAVPIVASIFNVWATTDSLGRSISLAFVVTSLGAFAVCVVPALLVTRRWPWTGVALALAYPAAWIAIMSCL